MSSIDQIPVAVVGEVISDRDVAKIAVLGVPDVPGVAARLFSDLAAAGVGAEMIVQSVMRGQMNDIAFIINAILGAACFSILILTGFSAVQVNSNAPSAGGTQAPAGDMGPMPGDPFSGEVSGGAVISSSEGRGVGPVVSGPFEEPAGPEAAESAAESDPVADWTTALIAASNIVVVWIIVILLLAVVVLAYLGTLAQGVMPEDAGEFQTRYYTLEPAHPTGYPLLILLGKLWVTLWPLGTNSASTTAAPMLACQGKPLTALLATSRAHEVSRLIRPSAMIWPFSMATRCVSGIVPTEERETNASWIAGHAPAKKRIGLSRPKTHRSSG